MADVAFICPQCGQTYEFAAHLAGKRGRCKVCREVFRIPEPAARPPGRAAAPPIRQVSPSPAPHPAPVAASLSAPAGLARPGDDGKIVFNCPTCGYGYRLAAKLAGKQGRCTACRGVFTIPARSLAPVPADPPRPSPAPARRPPGRGEAAARPVANDSGWWELDSSEAIPIPPPRPGAGRPGAAAAVTAAVAAVPAATDWTTFRRPEADGGSPSPPPRPPRPKWVTNAAIAAGAVGGALAFAVSYAVVSNAMRPSPPPVAEQPGREPKASPPPAKVADATGPSPGAAPAPRPSSSAARHREAVDALIRAYNEIADGYARIRDADSIRQGSEQVARGSEQLRATSHRGRSLPPLTPPEREALTRQTGPPLLQAVDRVLGELRRLKATDGLRSDFDRLIDAYSRTRQEIQREIGTR